MSLEEIRKNIKACCEEMIDFTTKNAELFEHHPETCSKSDNEINLILSRAKHAEKHSIAIYTTFAREIETVAAAPQQYETAIRSLANILKI